MTRVNDTRLDCGSHECIFGHPGGQGTNGGCHCLAVVPHAMERMRLAERIRQQTARLLEARARIARLWGENFRLTHVIVDGDDANAALESEAGK